MTRPAVPEVVSPVVERLGVRVRAAGPGADPAVLLGLALRRNPRRAQLLVSRVLGKHVPTDPRLVRGAALLLGALVADALAGRPGRALPVAALHAAVRGGPVDLPVHPEPVDALVLGYAETATALGHGVAEALVADHLHSTRRAVPGVAPVGGFAEEHSHATDHLLLPRDPALLRGDRPLVLVDDELSTGRTVLNTIAALHAVAPRERYVVAALVDARPDASLADGVAALGARLDVVALSRAAVELPADLPARAAALLAGLQEGHLPATRLQEGGLPATAGPLERVDLAGAWPAGLPVGGRHGFAAADHARLDAALPALAARLGVRRGERTLVLGTEELMALPLRLAQTLADGVDGEQGHDVRFSTTTRSPALVVDEPGYALRDGLVFPAHDDPADGPGDRFAYNVGRGWDHVVVVADPPADTPALRTGLLAALAPRTRRTTLVVTP